MKKYYIILIILSLFFLNTVQEEKGFIQQLEAVRGRVLHQKAVAVASLNLAIFNLATLKFRAAKSNASLEWAHELNKRGEQIITIIEETQNFMTKYIYKPEDYLLGKAPSDVVESCSDIMARNIYAKSGYYWITPDLKKKSFRVMCDMETLYGGWTLFGVKDANAYMPKNSFLIDFNRDRLTFKELRKQNDFSFLNINHFAKLEKTQEWEILIKKNENTFATIKPTISTDAPLKTIVQSLMKNWKLEENIQCVELGECKLCRGKGSSIDTIESKNYLEYWIRQAKQIKV